MEIGQHICLQVDFFIFCDFHLSIYLCQPDISNIKFDPMYTFLFRRPVENLKDRIGSDISMHRLHII